MRVLQILFALFLCCGTALASDPLDLTLGKFLLDPTFGKVGIVALRNSRIWSFQDLVIQPDGKILIAAHADGDSVNVALIRFLPNGRLDETFAGDGVATIDIDGKSDYATAIALRPDGKIHVAGYFKDTENELNFFLMRLLPDGALDPSFGEAGVVATDFYEGNDLLSYGQDIARDMVIGPDGKIVVVGSTTIRDELWIAMARYLENGDLDPEFGSDGMVLTQIGRFTDGYAAVLQPDGKIIVAGSSRSHKRDQLLVLRYNENGGLDPSFGENGYVMSSFIRGNEESAKAVALRPDGGIVVVGNSLQPNLFGPEEQVIVMAGFNADGTPNRSFGRDGKVITRLPEIGRSGVPESDSAKAMAITSGGRILVVGGHFDYEDDSRRWALVLRYGRDGKPDPTFGTGGHILERFGDSGGAYKSLAIDQVGRIVIVGHGDSRSPRVVRYLQENTKANRKPIGKKGS